MLDRLTGWGVVALWGAFNAVLVAVLAGFIVAGYGDSPYDLETYGSSVGLVFLIAGAVWLGRRRYRHWQYGWRQPAGAGSIVLFAIAAMLAWLGLAFGIWIIIIAAFPLLFALLLEYATRRRTGLGRSLGHACRDAGDIARPGLKRRSAGSVRQVRNSSDCDIEMRR